MRHATLGAAVKSMWNYESGNNNKLFAATETAIYDVTEPADELVPPTALVSSLTGGDWFFVNMQTSGGNYLVGVNGKNAPLEYNGLAYTASALTGAGLNPATLSHVWVFKNRLFFVQGGTTKFWYLPVGFKSGTLTSFSLSGVFKNGGSLLYGQTWSTDAGDGLDDYCVFVSNLGEVAVYQGTDPLMRPAGLW